MEDNSRKYFVIFLIILIFVLIYLGINAVASDEFVVSLRVDGYDNESIPGVTGALWAIGIATAGTAVIVMINRVWEWKISKKMRK